MKTRFKIMGLDCANCALELERAIGKIDGVNGVNVNFMLEKMEIEYDESKKKDIMERLKKVIRREEPDAEFKEI